MIGSLTVLNGDIVCRKAREDNGVGMDGEPATLTSGFVECCLVPVNVLEGFQEEDVSIA